MTTNVQFTRGYRSGNAMVEHATPDSSQSITATSTSQQSTITAPDRVADGVCIVTTDTDVWVAIGSNPTASAGNDHLVIAGQTRYFGDLAFGDKVAVISA